MKLARSNPFCWLDSAGDPLTAVGFDLTSVPKAILLDGCCSIKLYLDSISLLIRTEWSLTMSEDLKEPITAPKKKSVRCDKICTYVGSGNEPQRCKGKCAREPGHILNCKCRTHEMQ
jgi:hypothetical protein